jgi:S-adenosylmethionine:tRNA ribosyltransferase-isomerase
MNFQDDTEKIPNTSLMTEEFNFTLPVELIASEPSAQRGDDRLMVVYRQEQSWQHTEFKNLINFLPANALLVFNNSRVRKSRLMGNTPQGRRIEFLLIRPLEESQWLVLVAKSKRQRIGQLYSFGFGVEAELIADAGEGLKVVWFSGLTEGWLEQHGQIPLPPYMRREESPGDSERYQTIYANQVGSAAAPTAGLHFTQHQLDHLKQQGIEQTFITLHVGLGTFAPVRTDFLLDHKMHSEWYEITDKAATQINAAYQAQRPIIAVGTTACRVLESVFSEGQVQAGTGETNIFIYPGYTFKVLAGLITNFHTPKSTLLALVSAFAGAELIKEVYEEAIERKYRFFSYGDAMLLL